MVIGHDSEFSRIYRIGKEIDELGETIIGNKRVCTNQKVEFGGIAGEELA